MIRNIILISIFLFLGIIANAKGEAKSCPGCNLVVSITVNSNVSYNGGNNGSASATASLGTSPYTYL